MDDQTILGEPAEAVVEDAKGWHEWSTGLGLRENMGKQQFVEHTLSGKKEFRDLLQPLDWEECKGDLAVVLGAVSGKAPGGALAPKEHKRVEKFYKRC